MSMVPWTSRKLLAWDATCSDTYAPSNFGIAVTGAGAVAEKSEQYKISKYSHLDLTYMCLFPWQSRHQTPLARNPLSSSRT